MMIKQKIKKKSAGNSVLRKIPKNKMTFLSKSILYMMHACLLDYNIFFKSLFSYWFIVW